MEDWEPADPTTANGAAPTTDAKGPGRAKRPDGAAEERLQVLRMVEAGTLTAEEAASLLEALDRTTPATPQPRSDGPTPTPRARLLRIRVTEGGGPRPTVNIAVPLGLIETGLSMAQQHLPHYLGDTAQIREAILGGTLGHIIDIHDDEDHVEVIVE